MRGKPFEKGNKGRPKGSQNKFTRTIKQTIFDVFTELQSDPKHNLISFAKKYPREFHALAGKLIQTELHAEAHSGIKAIIVEPVSINFKDAE